MPSPSRAPLALVVSRSNPQVGDAELARGLAAREDWAVAMAWHRFAPMILTMAERALGSKSDAEDLAQDAFVRLLRKVATLEDSTKLRSFAYSVAVRTLKSELRYRKVKSWLSFSGPETLVDLRHSTPDVEGRDLLRKFHTLLDRLSTRDRLVFLLRRAESMTIQEIATTMDISTSTVKRSLAHASSRLSRWIDGDPALAELIDTRLVGSVE